MNCLDKIISTWTRRYLIARRIVAKRFFRLLAGMNRRLQPQTNFSIKPGYHHAPAIIHFDDTQNADEWQKEVYLLAASIATSNNYLSVVDVGCGSAYKLVNYLGSCKITGIETGATFEWLKQNYPNEQWLLFEETNSSTLHTDLVICSDVIEHIKNPDELMRFIQSIQSKQIIFSTPERNMQAGPADFGPPENPSHYREWSAEEFRNYVSQWFHIEEQRIFNDRSVTQVIVCKK